MASIPTKQTAAWIVNPGASGRIEIRHDVGVPQPGDGEVLLRMECSGICHSDCRNVLGMGAYTDIPGHEGVGKVISLGSSVPESLLGKRVGVKWLYSACKKCSVCKSGRTNHCAAQKNTGRSVLGTLQQYMVADADFVNEIPDGLSSEVAAPLLCAGLSLTGAVSKLEPEVLPGQWVAIIGAAGGLGHLGVQIAREKGYRIIAIDGGKEKGNLCKDLGASEYVDYLKDDVITKVKALTNGEGAHGVIVVAGSEKAYEQAPELARNCGVVVCVGLPRNDFHFPMAPIAIANRGLTIRGSSTGTEQQMVELFNQALEKKVLPRIEIQEFEQSDAIIQQLTKHEVTGRLVVKIP